MQYRYDGTYEGLLTVIFDSYANRRRATSITTDSPEVQLALSSCRTTTDKSKADRVLKKMKEICGKKVSLFFFKNFLSEKEEREMNIYRFIQRVIRENKNVLGDFRDPLIVEMQRTIKQVDREVHRMHAFVRFQETTDGKYMALIRPDFDVVPLIGPHFVKRYPGFEWVIYDIQRHKGIHFTEGQLVYVKGNALMKSELSHDDLTGREKAIQGLWRTYFRHVSIGERKNDRLHVQHIPKRYWPLLTEKNE